MDAVTLVEYGEGTVFASKALKVDALPVIHSTETYALRFTADGQTIVHSADTAYCEPLIGFARGADILVHSAMAVTDLRERWDEIHAIMATPGESGRVARLAQVPALAISQSTRTTII